MMLYKDDTVLWKVYFQIIYPPEPGVWCEVRPWRLKVAVTSMPMDEAKKKSFCMDDRSDAHAFGHVRANRSISSIASFDHRPLCAAGRPVAGFACSSTVMHQPSLADRVANSPCMHEHVALPRMPQPSAPWHRAGLWPDPRARALSSFLL
jgi:hypothetical protein